MEENIKYLDHELIISILESIEDVRDRLIVHLLYSYGLRASELTNLTLDDIDLGKKTIKILPLKQKRKIKQSFPLSAESIRLIKKWLSVRPKTDDKHLIVSKHLQSGAVTYSSISRTSIFNIIKKHLSRGGVEKEYQHPHTLRHSIAVSMANEGIDIYTVKEFLRHASIKSTEVYYTISNKIRDQRTIEAHRLLGL